MFIYIHIPFCKRICAYCDFPKVLYDKKYINNYLNNLELEVKKRYQNEKINSIFIGGGTPTALDYNELQKLLEITNIFKKNKNIEFTIESNIESLDEKKIALLKQYNVNRISIGVQSFNPKILNELNRNHSRESIFKIINNIKESGITNISIDLIYGVNENMNIVKEDIQDFLDLNIPHISCYSLIIEKNTIYGVNKRQYIDDEIEYKMYKYIEDTLEKNGYKHYEVSNYAKEGYFSTHNINYWDNGEYYGFGLGAVSKIANNRISNTKNLTKYLQGNTIAEVSFEDKDIDISNTIILGLRKVEGIDINKFKIRYGVDITKLYNIKELIKEKKLSIKNGFLYIEPKYYYLSNDILSNFV